MQQVVGMDEDEKVRTSVYVSKSLLQKAKALGINLSHVLQLGLLTEIELREKYEELFMREYLKKKLSELEKSDKRRGRESDLTSEDDELLWDDESGAWDDESGAP